MELERSEIERLRLLFAVLDTDYDGKITLQDLRAVNSCYNAGLSEDEFSQMLKDEESMDFSQFSLVFKDIWSQLGDANEIEDAIKVLGNSDSLELDAGVLKEATKSSDQSKSVISKFTKTNTITGKETFKGSQFLETFKR